MEDVLEALAALLLRIPRGPVAHGLEGLGAGPLQPPRGTVPSVLALRGAVLEEVREDPVDLELPEGLGTSNRAEALDGILIELEVLVEVRPPATEVLLAGLEGQPRGVLGPEAEDLRDVSPTLIEVLVIPEDPVEVLLEELLDIHHVLRFINTRRDWRGREVPDAPEPLEAHFILPRGPGNLRTLRVCDVPPGSGRLHFIRIVVHEAEAPTLGCHEGLEGLEEGTRRRRRSLMMLRDRLWRRRLGRSWDSMMGPP